MAYIFPALWLLCGFLHYGLYVGHFQGEYPLIAKDYWWTDRILAFVSILGGPISLLATLIVCDRREWRL